MKANFRQTTCGIAVAAAFAAFAPFDASAAGFTTGGAVFTTAAATPAVALPAPTAGATEIWWKAPYQWQMVVGTLSNDKCYVNGRGVTKVDFFLDDKLISSDTNMADGMSCVFDSTKVVNGTHELRAVAYGPNGAVYNEPVMISINNPAVTPTPTPIATPTVTPTP